MFNKSRVFSCTKLDISINTNNMYTCFTMYNLSKWNNGFSFTTYLATGNYNFVTLSVGSGSNILEKTRLASDGTDIEFFKNINQFKTRFADKI